MKKLSLLMMIAGFAFCAYSCKSDSGAMQQDDNSSGELYVMATRSATVSSGKDLDLLFTGDDIQSFKTGQAFEVPNGGAFIGEIVFTGALKADDILKRFGLYTTVFFFLDDKPLFDPV